jgi:23S rRNA (guanine2445-N2)-methyltransferase / 23S rRNA (guanine2069-N7)-methyltransferase
MSLAYGQKVTREVIDMEKTQIDAIATNSLEFFATCPKGFEQLLAGELASLGITGVRALRGQVAFSGTLAHAYKACLWSHIASRVTLVLAHVNAATSDELYEGISAIAWEEHLSLRETFAVDAHGTNDQLRNTQFVALRAKDAICDHLQARLGGRPSVDVRRPGVTVVVRVRGGRATVGIDLSGEPLFHRGTGRRNNDDGLGGLRSDYAAALLAAGAWHRCCRQASPVLAAAFAGSGALAVEAAGAALDRAPGLLRPRWGFERWLGHDADAWNALLDKADERSEKGAERAEALRIVSLDTRPGATSSIKSALRAAGLDVAVEAVSNKDALAGALSGAEAAATLGVCDLSWLRGEELAREVAALSCATAVADSLPAVSRFAALSLGRSLDAALGLTPVESHDTLIGRDEAALRVYEAGAAQAAPAEGEEPEAAPTPRATVTLKDGTAIPVLVAASDQFAARLQKVAKLRAKWARREDISCYRVYDADLPDYAVAIDLYQASEAARGRDKGGRWLVVQEYAAPKGIDLDLAHRRLLDVLAIAPVVLGVKPEDVTLRVRKRAKGGSQYANAAQAEKPAQGAARAGDAKPGRNERRGRLSLAPGAHLVDEGGLTFEVNLAERLDTGIFLDHRDVRGQVREMAKATQGSKRFLNLFAYTGTATCYAADGGAKHTTTVDLSRTYLDWAERNMARNGFEGEAHEYVQADVVRWISEQRRTPHRWDLVFCDPPTFSNSKRMGRDSFDVQRDHAELLIGISRLLTKDGVCLFSCNLRGFTPDVEKLNRFGVDIKDVTEGTIPEDFKRNAKIHHVYLVRRTPRQGQ